MMVRPMMVMVLPESLSDALALFLYQQVEFNYTEVLDYVNLMNEQLEGTDLHLEPDGIQDAVNGELLITLIDGLLTIEGYVTPEASARAEALCETARDEDYLNIFEYLVNNPEEDPMDILSGAVFQVSQAYRAGYERELDKTKSNLH